MSSRRTADTRIADAPLTAIVYDNLDALDRLMRHDGWNADRDPATDADEFPPHVTPLMLAAQCGQRATIEYLLARGHRVDRPHPPRCGCPERCADGPADPVADGRERLDAYRAICNPTYVCYTEAADPILACFRLHRELLECGDVDQFYKSEYDALAQQVRMTRRPYGPYARA